MNRPAPPEKAETSLSPPDAADRGRFAALRLHGLAEADRAWLIARLAPAQQRRVRGWLAELRALGVPPEAGREVTIEATPRPAPPAVADEPLQRITAADVQTLLERLRCEPPMLAARLLALHAWPWARAVREQLQRDHAEPLAAVETIPPERWTEFDRSLLRHLAGRLPPVPASGSRAELPRGSWLARWRRRSMR